MSIADKCASVHCKDNHEAGSNYCSECHLADKWQRDTETREDLGLMVSKSNGTLPMAQQELILQNRAKRRAVTKEMRRVGELCSAPQLEQILEHKLSEGTV